MFKNMKVGLRLGLGFSLVIGFMISIVVVGINQMMLSREDLKHIIEINNVRVQLANNMIDNARETAISVRNVLLLKYNNEPNERIQEVKRNLNEQRRRYNENVAKVKQLIPKDQSQGLALCNKISAIADTVRQLQDKSIELAVADKQKEGTKFMLEAAYPSVKRWINDVDSLIHYSEERTALRYREAIEVQEKARTNMYMLGVLAVALAIVMAIFLTLGITRPLQGIMDGVNILSSTSSEILAATTQVASGTAENASAIAETTTTVEEVRQAAELSSKKAKNVADGAQRLEQVSKTGQKAVEETVTGIREIRSQMESIAQTIIRLSEQGQSIGGIIAAVTDIADQSNLLAVNAAIEAARAGEQGKGFAVVAQEIKSLAEQSKQATTQVRTILNDVQKATSAAVMATEQGSKAVEAGVKQSVQAGEAIRVLAESSTEAVQAATQIGASSQQQVVGMNQIGTAMENINQAGAETAVSMKQAEIAAKNLHELGQKIKGLVGAITGQRKS